jgi:hypothetical protein
MRAHYAVIALACVLACACGDDSQSVPAPTVAPVSEAPVHGEPESPAPVADDVVPKSESTAGDEGNVAANEIRTETVRERPPQRPSKQIPDEEGDAAREGRRPQPTSSWEEMTPQERANLEAALGPMDGTGWADEIFREPDPGSGDILMQSDGVGVAAAPIER